jgi:hypothetical protein
MLAEEVSRALDELAAVIAKLKFVVAELQRAKQTELKRQREQTPSDDAR